MRANIEFFVLYLYLYRL